MEVYEDSYEDEQRNLMQGNRLDAAIDAEILKGAKP